jgi:hypothetical protein
MTDNTVKIACKIPNGIKLRLMKEGYDDGTGSGVRPQVVDGAAVTLAGPSSLHAGAGNTEARGQPHGVTEVDAGWWARWHEQNKEGILCVEEFIYELKE